MRTVDKKLQMGEQLYYIKRRWPVSFLCEKLSVKKKFQVQDYPPIRQLFKIHMKSCQRSLLRWGGMRRCVGLGLHDKTAGWQRASQQGWGEPQHIWCTHTLGPMYCFTHHTVLLSHHARLYQWQRGLVELYKTQNKTKYCPSDRMGVAICILQFLFRIMLRFCKLSNQIIFCILSFLIFFAKSAKSSLPITATRKALIAAFVIPDYLFHFTNCVSWTFYCKLYPHISMWQILQIVVPESRSSFS